MLRENLAVLRNINGLSQEEISEKIGISRQAYAKWESGRTVPDIEKCKKLADFYGITVDSLIKNEEAEGLGTIPPAPAGKNIWGTVTLNERGQIALPKAVRDKFHLSSGDRLVVLSDEEGIAMIKAETFEEKMRKMMLLASKEAK